ncbi:MAG: tRNA dihydrouridine(20/20a) synthase DusA [Alphaproteobacteria bacterium]
MLNLNRTYTVAPMMDWTDRHCRFFHRLMSKQAVLYTEMVTTGALIFGDTDRFLRFNPEEQPVALQLGGSVPKDLAVSAVKAQDYGYAEVNLNVGCPSDRVQSGCFGAALMAEPQLVADCVKAMQDVVDIPVTVKCRIGIDDQDEDEDFQAFIDTVAATGCSTFIVHARKAWLKGLSPKENRDIPPLNYERVFRLKQARPELEVILNGGLKTHEECLAVLDKVDGVMVGREAYHNPWIMNQVDQLFYGADENQMTREEVLREMAIYADRAMAQGAPLNSVTRHMLGLYNLQPGARAFRRFLSEGSMKKNNPTPKLLLDVLELKKAA